MLIGLFAFRFYTIQYNTNKNLYSAVIRKNESEALFGPLGDLYSRDTEII